LTHLEKKFEFIYKATDTATGLIEHELDCVFEGNYETQEIIFNYMLKNSDYKFIPKIRELDNQQGQQDLYYYFRNLGVYRKFNDDCELEGIAEVDHEDNVDLELVDFIKWLREYNDVDRIKWGCSDFTKNIYMKILGD
jgi:hypothetical protein